MKLSNTGIYTSEVEVSDISPFGIWLYYYGKEYFLDYNYFPWFKDAPVSSVFQIKEESEGHLRWELLDIDLSIDSIIRPESFPQVYK